MKPDIIKEKLIDTDGSKKLSDSIGAVALKYILWFGFNGSTNQPHSWAIKWERFPFYAKYSGRQIVLVYHTLKKVLRINSVNVGPICIDTIQKQKVGTVLISDEKHFTFWNISRYLRNSLAHAMFFKPDEETCVLFNYDKNDINFSYKIRESTLSSILKKWSSFSSALLNADGTKELVSLCFRYLGFDGFCIIDNNLTMECMIGGKSYFCVFPLIIEEVGGFNDRKERYQKIMKMYPGRVLTVFLHSTVKSDSNRKYLFIEEFLECANRKRVSANIQTILWRLEK